MPARSRPRIAILLVLALSAWISAARVAAAATPVTYNTYWGDLHGHTMETPVTLTPARIDAYITYARDVQRLDFVALTEKDFDLSDAEWSDARAKATAYTSSGHFVALSAFEWGDAGYGSFGHRPVYFLTDDQPLLRSDAAGTDHVSELLDRVLSTTNGFTGIAHPDLSVFPTDWDYFDAVCDRLAEVYSRHGHFETGSRGIQQALGRGFRFGIVAVSDTRSAEPGAYGLTAVLATSLSKSNVHAALKARRTYATSGARIALRVTADGHQVGEEYTATTGPTFSVQCTPTAALVQIEILKNNVVVYSYVPPGASPLALRPDGWRAGRRGEGRQGSVGAGWTRPGFEDGAWDTTSLEDELQAPSKDGSALRLRQSFSLGRVPQAAILQAGLAGEYRLFVNGRLVVDTHTFGHDDPNAPHECGGPDGFELAGRPENFRRLGFYDLRSLGAPLQAGENVVALEYEPRAGTEAAPTLSLLSLPAALPVSFTWADAGFTGPSFYYVRVTQADGHQAWASPIWVDRMAPDTTPPQSPTKLRASKDAGDVYLEWPKVLKDTAGNVETISFYRVFRGTTPDFAPDRSGLTNQVTTCTKSRVRDPGALQASGNYYYRVAAVDAAGNESPAASNLAFMVHRSLPFHTGISNIYWMSMPYQVIYNTAAALARDLNGGGTSGPCTKVMRWEVGMQRPESWVYLGGQWLGTNFALVPGQSVAVTIRQSFDAVIVGAHDPGSTVRLYANPGVPTLNWISVPINTSQQFAYQLVQEMNGGYFPGPVTRITRLNPDLQTYQSYQWNGGSWGGTNFVLVPGEAYGVEVRTTADWIPGILP